MKILRHFSFFLMPAVVQVGLSFATLPLTTYVLAAADFGVFALVASLTGFGHVLGSMGCHYTLSAHFRSLEPARRGGLVSANLFIGLLVASVFAALLIAMWPVLSRWLELTVPTGVLYLMLASMLLSLPWVLAAEITVLNGQSGTFAAVLIAQSITSAVVSLVGLYVFHLGMLALFVGALAGAIVQSAGALRVLGPYLGFAGIAPWVRPILRIGPITSVGGLAESLQTASERTLLSAYAGLTQLGIYNQSQQYRQTMFLFVKAVTRSIWPVTLDESRQDPLAFTNTGQAWGIVHIGLTMAGVFMATTGKELIALLTHDKFTAAAPLVALWMVMLLVKHSGRSEFGYLIASHHTKFVSSLMLLTVALSIPCMMLLIPRFGIFGALAAVMIQDLIFRLGLTVRARMFQRVPFQDGWVVKGALVIVLTLAASRSLNLSLAQNIGLMLGLECVLAWIVCVRIYRLPMFHPPDRRTNRHLALAD
jgi:O-antigen/teichoic acid export membrane protein